MGTSGISVVRRTRASPRVRVLAAIAMPLGVLVAAAILFVVFATRTQETPTKLIQLSATVENGRIVYEWWPYDSDEDSEIYTLNADGTGSRKLTDNRVDDSNPIWSPGGGVIAFSSYRLGENDSEIYKMKADGSGRKRITDNLVSEGDPAWSPDGTKIAFVRSWYENNVWSSDIFVMRVDGSRVRRLTTDPTRDGHPDWSPDGQKIAFHSDRGGDYQGDYQVYVMDADGTDPVPLAQGQNPAFSPDGTKIAFNYGDGAGIYVTNADGSGTPDMLVSCDEGSEFPAWSPDGTLILSNTIVYRGDLVEPRDLTVQKADGTMFDDGSWCRKLADDSWGDADWRAKGR